MQEKQVEYWNRVMQEKQLRNREDQASSWEEVWALCISLGMDTNVPGTGEQCVLDFIKDLHKEPKISSVSLQGFMNSSTELEVESPKSYKEAFERSAKKAEEITKNEYKRAVHPKVGAGHGPIHGTLFNTLKEENDKAKSDKIGTGLILIPFYSLLNLGKIFIEGLRYGRDNWKKGVHDKDYQEERLEHAILHLIKYKEGDRSEEHLAKVSWFCFTQLELERLEEINGNTR